MRIVQGCQDGLRSTVKGWPIVATPGSGRSGTAPASRWAKRPRFRSSSDRPSGGRAPSRRAAKMWARASRRSQIASGITRMATQIINHPIRNTAPSVKTTKSRARTGHGQESSHRQHHRCDLHIVEIDRAARSPYGSCRWSNACSGRNAIPKRRGEKHECSNDTVNRQRIRRTVRTLTPSLQATRARSQFSLLAKNRRMPSVCPV